MVSNSRLSHVLSPRDHRPSAVELAFALAQLVVRETSRPNREGTLQVTPRPLALHVVAPQSAMLCTSRRAGRIELTPRPRVEP